MFKQIDISIVSYNSEKWISVFMDSLINQKYPLDKINLYFSDNNSKDNTVKLIEEYQVGYENQFSSFSIFKRQNDGFGAGHNYNVNQGKSEYVLVTNLDLEFEENSIKNIVEFAIEDNDNVASWELRQKPYEHPKDYNPVTLEVNWSSSACILFNRSIFLEVGGYENKIFMYGEDVEISYRLRDSGYKLKYVPKAVCWHYAYEHENQIKKLQFYGSIESNLCLRIRYGTIKDLLEGYVMYLALFFIPVQFENHRKELWHRLKNITTQFLYYFKTRKRSNIRFQFLLWDYEVRRDGAFYEFLKKDPTKELGKISVIVRTYLGRTNLLEQALESIANQTYNDIEIIVIEDGSNEAENIVIEFSKIAKNISIIYKSIEKSGRCKAGNAGLEIATGKYLAFLDDDDLLYADHFEVLVHELLNRSDMDAIYSSAFEVPSRIEGLDPLKIIEGNKHVIYRQKFYRRLLWNQNFIPIQSILFKRELYEQYKGFDEELDNLEDWNLWTRYSLNSNFYFLDKTTSMYRVPLDNEQRVKRQNNMNDYYQKALMRQDDLYATISISEIKEIAMEYAKNQSFKYRVIRKMTHIMKKNYLTSKIFDVIRKIYFNNKKSL